MLPQHHSRHRRRCRHNDNVTVIGQRSTCWRRKKEKFISAYFQCVFKRKNYGEPYSKLICLRPCPSGAHFLALLWPWLRPWRYMSREVCRYISYFFLHNPLMNVSQPDTVVSAELQRSHSNNRRMNDGMAADARLEVKSVEKEGTIGREKNTQYKRSKQAMNGRAAERVRKRPVEWTKNTGIMTSINEAS